MGLEEGPILYDAGCYRFTFKSMTHELIGGLNVTKGADAMNHLSEDGLDEINSNHGFWQDNE